MGRIGAEVEALVSVIARLRAPDGCPWDRAQTHTSLIPYLLEEAYEAAAALERGNPEEIVDELGDILLQVALHAQIGAEEGQFDLGDIAAALRDKLIARHPHVFGTHDRAKSPEEVKEIWDEVKEKEGRGLDLARPALLAARKYLESRPEAISHPYLNPPPSPPDDPEGEIGRLLLAVCSLAAAWKVEPELALRRTLTELERKR
jgi:XTP/dITP diphosphohydrolase